MIAFYYSENNLNCTICSSGVGKTGRDFLFIWKFQIYWETAPELPDSIHFSTTTWIINVNLEIFKISISLSARQLMVYYSSNSMASSSIRTESDKVNIHHNNWSINYIRQCCCCCCCWRFFKQQTTTTAKAIVCGKRENDFIKIVTLCPLKCHK